MPDVDWERVAEALFTAERLESNYERGLDDRMVVEPEVLAAARWGLEAQQRGWELYRPEDCVTVEWCADHQSRWGYNPVCGWSHTGHSCPKRTYRLVPVESEDRQ